MCVSDARWLTTQRNATRMSQDSEPAPKRVAQDAIRQQFARAGDLETAKKAFDYATEARGKANDIAEPHHLPSTTALTMERAALFERAKAFDTFGFQLLAAANKFLFDDGDTVMVDDEQPVPQKKE